MTGPVALVLTVFNEGASLGRLLSSIERQTRAPDEVVICDAGSSDDTMAIIEGWRPPGSTQLHCLIEPGANIAVGRNRAIAATRAPLIAVTDGGCELCDEWLESICQPLEDRPDVSLVYGRTIARGRSAVGRAFADLYSARSEDGSNDIAMRSSRTVAFRRDAWAAVGGYPEQLELAGEDTLFFMDLERRFGVTEAPEACVHWWHGMDSLGGVYRVHRRNAFGAGEANYWTGRFMLVAAAYATALGTAGSRRLPRGARWLPLAAIAARDLPRIYRATGLRRSLALAGLLTLARDMGLLVGHGRGLREHLRRRALGSGTPPGRSPSVSTPATVSTVVDQS